MTLRALGLEDLGSLFLISRFVLGHVALSLFVAVVVVVTANETCRCNCRDDDAAPFGDLQLGVFRHL